MSVGDQKFSIFGILLIYYKLWETVGNMLPTDPLTRAVVNHVGNSGSRVCPRTLAELALLDFRSGARRDERREDGSGEDTDSELHRC